jgi:MFS family permease
LASKAAILSFIASFGTAKAIANVLAGRMSDAFGRKRILIAGWLIGLPVPVLILLAPSWTWVAFANVLLGINQGLCWSTTVIMKIDLVGPVRRGLAMGLNEAAGYLAVSAAAFASGYLAAFYGFRVGPAYLGLGLAVAGLLASALFVRESQGHATYESALHEENREISPDKKPFSEIFGMTSWWALSSCSNWPPQFTEYPSGISTCCSTARRGILEGPGLATFDFSVFKNIPIRERMNLAFRTEFFNITDRTNLSLPNPTIFSGANISPSAGRNTSTSTTSRQIQLGLKLSF